MAWCTRKLLFQECIIVYDKENWVKTVLELENELYFTDSKDQWKRIGTYWESMPQQFPRHVLKTDLKNIDKNIGETIVWIYKDSVSNEIYRQSYQKTIRFQYTELILNTSREQKSNYW